MKDEDEATRAECCVCVMAGREQQVGWGARGVVRAILFILIIGFFRWLGKGRKDGYLKMAGVAKKHLCCVFFFLWFVDG